MISQYDWAHRELDKLKCNGKPLDATHLSALIFIASNMLDDMIKPMFEKAWKYDELSK